MDSGGQAGQRCKRQTDLQAAAQRPHKRQQLLPRPPGQSNNHIVGYEDALQLLAALAAQHSPPAVAAGATSSLAAASDMTLLAQLLQFKQPHMLPPQQQAQLQQRVSPQLQTAPQALAALMPLFQPPGSNPLQQLSPLQPAVRPAGLGLADVLGLGGATGAQAAGGLYGLPAPGFGAGPAPADPATAAAAVGGAGDVYFAAVQQHLLQQQPIFASLLQQQMLLEAAAGMAAGLTPSALCPPLSPLIHQQPLPQQQQVLATPPAAAQVPFGLSPATAPVTAAAAGDVSPHTNLLQLITAAADIGSLLAAAQHQQRHASLGMAAPFGGTLQQELLQQLQPSILAARPVVQSAPPSPWRLPRQQQQQQQQQQHSATVTVTPAPTRPQPGGYPQQSTDTVQGQQQQQQQQQQGIPGFTFPQLRALQQLKAIGSQVQQQQQRRAAGQFNTQTAAELVQALTAAANQLLHVPTLPAHPPTAAATANQQPRCDNAAPVGAVDAAEEVVPRVAAAAPEATAPAAAAAAAAAPVLAALVGSSPATATSTAGAPPQQCSAPLLPGDSPTYPANGVAALAQPVTPFVGAGNTGTAAAAAGSLNPLLQEGYAAMAALAALAAAAAAAPPAAPPAVRAAGGVANVAMRGRSAAAAAAVDLARVGSVGGQGPAGSEETVESEQSEGERSEGQGSSSSRELTETH